MTGFAANIPSRSYGETFRDVQAVRRSSWGAIFAGSAIAIAVQLLLTVLGAAIGLSVLANRPDQQAATGVGIGEMIWYAVVTIIALFAGGFVASRLSGMYRRIEGVLHGAATWAVATLVAAILATTVMGVVAGGAWNMMNTKTDQNTAVATPAAGQPDNARNIQTAKEAAGPTAGAAWGLFILMSLGLLASVAGGAAGLREADREERFERDRRPAEDVRRSEPRGGMNEPVV